MGNTHSISQNEKKRELEESENDERQAAKRHKISQNLAFGLTKMQTENFEYVWRVKNFDKFKESPVNSPEFGKGGKKWKLTIYPMVSSDLFGITADVYTGAGIYLELISPGCSNISANVQISRTLNGETVENFSSYKFYNLHASNQMEKVNVMRWNEFFAYHKEVEIDEIVTICKITLNYMAEQNEIVDLELSNSSNPFEKNIDKLRTDFGTLLKSPEETSDLRILVKGEREFKVHKIILSARSEVFSRMLATDMQEAQNSEIKIDDFDPEIVEKMLEYIYTGKTEISKNPLELFQISDKYDLPDLKADCEVELAKNLNFENALSLFEIGDKYNAAYLKSLALEFIIRSDGEIVKHSEIIENLKKDKQLTIEVLKEALLMAKKEQNKTIN